MRPNYTGVCTAVLGVKAGSGQPRGYSMTEYAPCSSGADTAQGALCGK